MISHVPAWRYSQASFSFSISTAAYPHNSLLISVSPKLWRTFPASENRSNRLSWDWWQHWLLLKRAADREKHYCEISWATSRLRILNLYAMYGFETQIWVLVIWCLGANLTVLLLARNRPKESSEEATREWCTQFECMSEGKCWQVISSRLLYVLHCLLYCSCVVVVADSGSEWDRYWMVLLLQNNKEGGMFRDWFERWLMYSFSSFHCLACTNMWSNSRTFFWKRVAPILFPNYHYTVLLW